MKVHLILLVLCHQVISQQDTPPPNGDFECRFVNFTCEPGLKTTTRTFSQVEICDPILRDPAVAGACTFVYSGGSPKPVAFKCPNTYGLRMSLLCIPPDVPNTTDYCFCEGLPKIKISEVPDIQFNGNATIVTEDEGTVTVCAIAGELDKEFTPVKVAISTASDTAQDGEDFVGINQEFSFTESYQTHCVDVSILKDGVDEVDELFHLILTLQYAPFDIPLDEYTVTIVDSDIVGIGFEQKIYSVSEHAGSVLICAITNVTLNGSRTASGVIKTKDVSAEANKDYQPLHEPIVFQVNGDSRACVNVTIRDGNVRGEPHAVFVAELTSTDAPVFAGQAVVVILDKGDQLYPFGGHVGDKELVTGIANVRNTSSKVMLTPAFRFFSNVEDTLYVNTNGVLSFKHSFHKTEPQDLPLKSPALISPYWEDFSTVRFGRVYYRITSDSNLLLRAQYHLQDLFPSGSLFFPSYLFIATWDRVPQLGTNAPGDATKHNTFQVVLATDGEKSFVFFIYHDIQWGSGGVGFSAGDGVRSFTDSLASEALDHGSNVDIPGVYAYRVDLPTIISPGDCKGEGKVVNGELVCKKQEVVQIGFEKTSYTVGEGDKSVSVCANLIAGIITTPVSVTLVTMDTASAHAGDDYTKQETELIFDKATRQACAEINIVDDGKEEKDESFLVVLVTIQTNLVSLKPQIVSVNIKDNDGYGGAMFGNWLFGSTVIVVLFMVFYFCFKQESSKESDKKKD